MVRETGPLPDSEETSASLLRDLALSAKRLRKLADAGDWDGVAAEAGSNEALFARLAATLPAASAHERQALAPLVAELLDRNSQVVALIAPRLKDIGQLLDQMGGR